MNSSFQFDEKASKTCRAQTHTMLLEKHQLSSMYRKECNAMQCPDYGTYRIKKKYRNNNKT